MEIVESKKQQLFRTPPQLAPRSTRTLGRTGSESGSIGLMNPSGGGGSGSGSGTEAANRRAMYSASRDVDVYGSLESGYAKITPRKSSVDISKY